MFGAQQDLVRSIAGFELGRSGGVVALAVAGFDLQCLLPGAGVQADHGHAAIVRGGLLFLAGRTHLHIGDGGRAIGISRDHEDLVFQIGDQRAALGDRGDHQGRFAHRNRFAARLAVSRRILHGGFDEHRGGSLTQWTPREVIGQPQVKSIGSFGVCLAVRGDRLELRHVDARCLDADLRSIHRLSKKVVCAHSAGDVVAGPIAALRMIVFARQVYRNFELRQYISLYVERQFSVVGGGVPIAHRGAQMIGPQIHFVGQFELGRSDAELIGLGCFLEYLVAA